MDCLPEGDVFEGLQSTIQVRKPVPAPEPSPNGPSVQLGGSWAFYRNFCRAHQIDRVSDIIPPELGVLPEVSVPIPVAIQNGPVQGRIELRAIPPAGWTLVKQSQNYEMAPNEARIVQIQVKDPAKSAQNEEMKFELWAKGERVSDTKLRVRVFPDAMPF